MKKRQLIILFGVLLIIALIYIPILTSKENTETQKTRESVNYLPVISANNTTRNQFVSSYGQVIGNAQLDVSMRVQGEIDRDNRTLKPGTTFKKNELLIKVDRVEAIYNLLSRRSGFINLVSGILPDIYLDLPEEKKKWDTYLSKLSATSPLPELPEVNSQKEKLLVNARNIPSEYYAIKAAETQLENYFYVAPFNGVITESFVEPGSMINVGSRLLTIAKTGDYEVKAPINIPDIPLYKSTKKIFFKGPNGDTLGTGKLLRISKTINQQTQSVDAYFSINPVKGSEVIIGSFVNLDIETPLFEKSITLPENAVYNSTVQVLADSLITEKRVKIIGRKPDSLFISGVSDSTIIVLDPYKSPGDSTRFVGIHK